MKLTFFDRMKRLWPTAVQWVYPTTYLSLFTKEPASELKASLYLLDDLLFKVSLNDFSFVQEEERSSWHSTPTTKSVGFERTLSLKKVPIFQRYERRLSIGIPWFSHLFIQIGHLVLIAFSINLTKYFAQNEPFQLLYALGSKKRVSHACAV